MLARVATKPRVLFSDIQASHLQALIQPVKYNSSRVLPTLGTLRCHDSNGNENIKKQQV